MTDAVPQRQAGEERRLEAVRRYDVLDSPPDGAFERLTRLAARLLGTPMAIVSIVDHDRIWFKSHHGLDAEQVEREPGLCASAILQDEPWVVEDARHDPRALANPLVAGELGLQFYAGAPLRTHDGHNLGTMCVLDTQPRPFDARDREILEDLAALVVDELELRLAARRADSASDLRLHLLEERRRQAMELNDDVVQSLAAAHLSLTVGTVDDVARHVDRALAAGKRILAEMAVDAPSLRRDRPAGQEHLEPATPRRQSSPR